MVRKLMSQLTPNLIIQIITTLVLVGVAWGTIKSDMKAINDRNNAQDLNISKLEIKFDNQAKDNTNDHKLMTQLLYKIAGKLNINQ